MPLLPPDQEAFIDAVARRVIALLEEQQPARGALVDARTLARLFGMSISAVHEHAEEFGAVRLGSGGRPILRFDLDRAREAWTRRVLQSDPGKREPRTQTDEVGTRRRRRGRSTSREARGLLPVKDRSAV